jgi:hypothetical protein
MKKFICVLMVVCCVGCLCSCAISQPNNYAELDERISRLEKLFGEPNKPTTNPTETPTITDFVEPLPSNITEPLPTNCTDSCVYDLSEITPENIVEIIKYYIDNRPKNGDTYESVKSRLQVEPLSWREPNKYYGVNNIIEASFVNDINSDYHHDYIKTIKYSLFDLGMDGITLENCETIIFKIDFNIAEYSRAEKVFDAVVNYLNSNTNNGVEIQKQDGMWKISYHPYNINTNSIFVPEINGWMKRATNSYSFYINLKINDTTQE